MGEDMAATGTKPRRFERAVTIRTDHGERSIVDVGAAASILLSAFPRETARREAAITACLNVMRGQAHSPLARRALVSAALEVGILAGD
jgi:hypothetical protein